MEEKYFTPEDADDVEIGDDVILLLNGHSDFRGEILQFDANEDRVWIRPRGRSKNGPHVKLQFIPSRFRDGYWTVVGAGG